MINVAILSVIRRWHLRDQMPIREIARRTGLSRNTVKNGRVYWVIRNSPLRYWTDSPIVAILQKQAMIVIALDIVQQTKERRTKQETLTQL